MADARGEEIGLTIGWLDALLIGCGVQNLIIAAGLWLVPRDRVAARRLALALVVMVGMMMVYVIGWTGRADPPPMAAFFPLSLPLALGPLLYGYVHALATGRKLAREPLHFLPAAAQFLYLATILLLPETARAAWKEDVHDDLVKPLIEGAVLLSLAGYSIAGLRLLGRYRGWLMRARSDADLYAGRWIGRTLGALLASLAALIALRLYTWNIGELEAWPLQLWIAAWSAWLAVEGWRHGERAFPPMETEEPSAAESNTHDWRALGERWKLETEDGGWWRESDLTLAELARRLGTNTSYVSRAVNEGLGMNFNTFVNRMRADEVARRMQADPAARDLLTLALDAGFSSKATFNRAFRSAYGIAPSQFRRLKS
ncbi:MAG: helix-turn-helix domain-containing protein [Pseudomonadota bacterium]